MNECVLRSVDGPHWFCGLMVTILELNGSVFVRARVHSLEIAVKVVVQEVHEPIPAE